MTTCFAPNVMFFSYFNILKRVFGKMFTIRTRAEGCQTLLGSFLESPRQKNTPATAQNKKLVIIQLEFLFIDGIQH